MIFFQSVLTRGVILCVDGGKLLEFEKKKTLTLAMIQVQVCKMDSNSALGLLPYIPGLHGLEAHLVPIIHETTKMTQTVAECGLLPAQQAAACM